jgi:hypothetical protein
MRAQRPDVASYPSGVGAGGVAWTRPRGEPQSAPARIRSPRAASTQRTRSRKRSSVSLGTNANDSSPAANSLTIRCASRRSVFTRSPGARNLLPVIHADTIRFTWTPIHSHRCKTRGRPYRRIGSVAR